MHESFNRWSQEGLTVEAIEAVVTRGRKWTMSGYDSIEYGRHIASGLIDARVPGGKWVHVFRDGDDINIVTTDTQESASIAQGNDRRESGPSAFDVD